MDSHIMPDRAADAALHDPIDQPAALPIGAPPAAEGSPQPVPSVLADPGAGRLCDPQPDWRGWRLLYHVAHDAFGWTSVVIDEIVSAEVKHRSAGRANELRLPGDDFALQLSQMFAHMLDCGPPSQGGPWIAARPGEPAWAARAAPPI